MKATPSPSPSERLLSLMAVLLEARGPLTLSEIQSRMDGQYGPPREDADGDPALESAFQAGRKKFLRDKKTLDRVGVRVRTVLDEERVDAYRLLPEDAGMPRIALDDRQLGALRLAASLARRVPGFPLLDDLSLALGKIEAACAGMRLEPSDEDVAAGCLFQPGRPLGGPTLAAVLPTLADAVATHARLRITYRSALGETTKREVDPWGLYLREGAWHLVGWCHLRKDERTFDAHRVLQADAGKPGTAPLPPDFDLSRYSGREAWELPVHDPVTVRLRLDASVAGLARSRLSRAAVVAREPDGQATLDVTATDLEPLLGLVLSLWGRARVVGPPAAVARFDGLVRGILDRHATEVRP